MFRKKEKKREFLGNRLVYFLFFRIGSPVFEFSTTVLFGGRSQGSPDFGFFLAKK